MKTIKSVTVIYRELEIVTVCYLQSPTIYIKYGQQYNRDKSGYKSYIEISNGDIVITTMNFDFQKIMAHLAKHYVYSEVVEVGNGNSHQLIIECE